MTDFERIKDFEIINEVDENKVNELIKSMIENGWQGAPILYSDLGLVTGSHRIVALNRIDEMYVEDEITSEEARVLDEVEAVDVTDEINGYCEREDCCWEDIAFDCLGEVFEGTYIEQYKNDIKEW